MVLLHRWTQWRDRDAPNNDTLMVPLQLLAMIDDQSESTCIVHCSAGIGRTGTVLAVEICIQRLRSAKSVNIAEVSIVL
jgi:protein tyrosine phosphatase